MRVLLAFFLLPLYLAHLILSHLGDLYGSLANGLFHAVGRDHIDSALKRFLYVLILLAMAVVIFPVFVLVALIAGLYSGFETIGTGVVEILQGFAEAWDEAAPKASPAAPSSASATSVPASEGLAAGAVS